MVPVSWKMLPRVVSPMSHLRTCTVSASMTLTIALFVQIVSVVLPSWSMSVVSVVWITP
ncbi:MAG: hypothetical protein BWY91_01234 [bacterium ADurb.BinA028]|nr:MAG: hypothetical protein BWY91_01234 [bacterium ADurb.BinA028]